MTRDRVEAVRARLESARQAGARVQTISKETGVSRGSLYNLLNGTHATEDLTLDRLEPWLDRWEQNRNGSVGLVHDPEAPEMENSVSTAADIIRVVGRADYIRQAFKQADRTNQANLGYILAQRHRLPPDEMKKILEWRDEILRSDEND